MIFLKKVPVSIVATFAGCLNDISTGLQFGWSSVSVPKLTDKDAEIFISSYEGFWITVAILMGTLISPLFSNLFVNKIGRKPMLLIALAFISLSWIIMAFANSAILFIISRFLGGFGDGVIASVIVIFYGEISSSHNRGCINGIIPAMFSVGVLMITVLGHYVNIFNMSLISLLLAIISFLIILYVPESPYYLIMTKKYKEAKVSIEKFNPALNKETEFIRIFNAVEEQLKNTPKFVDIFTVQAYRKVLFIAIGLKTFQQCVGTQTILFYFEEVLSNSNQSELVKNYGAIIVFSIQTVSSFLCAMIVDRVGRKPLLLMSLIGVSLALSCQSVYLSIHNLTNLDLHSYELIPVIALMFYLVSVQMGIFIIPCIVISEIFPVNIKSAGVCCSEYSYIVLGIMMAKIFQFTKDQYGMHIPYYLFLASSVMGCLFIYFFVPETKGKTLEEIQEVLNVKYSN